MAERSEGNVSTRTGSRRTTVWRTVAVGLVLGTVFGALVSLVNELSGNLTGYDGHANDSGWAVAARLASKLLDAGWAWAGLAVAVGWLVGTFGHGVLAGTLSLLAASAAYFGTDSIVRAESLAIYQGELAYWAMASVLFGPVLGAVGAAIRRPGVIGLLAALTVPVGATLQMFVMPPRAGILADPVAEWARIVVWTAALCWAAAALLHFRRRGS